MNKIIRSVCLIITLMLASCAHFYNAVDPNYSEIIGRSKPTHEGSFTAGIHGPYVYQAYSRSVQLKATTGVVRAREVNVYDMDNDNRFDTVFVLFDHKWRYGSTREIRKEFSMIDPGLSQTSMMKFIDLATDVKRSLIVKNEVPRVKAVAPAAKKPTTAPPKAKIVATRTQPIAPKAPAIQTKRTRKIVTPSGQVYREYLTD